MFTIKHTKQIIIVATFSFLIWRPPLWGPKFFNNNNSNDNNNNTCKQRDNYNQITTT